MKCKECKHLKISLPDAMNEGLAYCTKYEVSTWLVGKQWKRKVEKLECYENEDTKMSDLVEKQE